MSGNEGNEKMYLITGSRISGNSVRIYVLTPDGDTTEIRLTKAAAAQYMSEGREIPHEEYRELVSLGKKCEAVTCAVRLIADSSYSEKKLKRKIAEKTKCGSEAAEYAIRVLKKNGMIDDAKSSLARAGSIVRYKHRGRYRVTADLMAEGYSQQTAKEAAAGVPDEEYEDALMYHANRKIDPSWDRYSDEMRKAEAALVRLGFGRDEIAQAVGRIKNEH